MENVFNISEVIIDEEIQAYCPLGEQYYDAAIQAVVYPDKEIPDYLDITKDIKALEGRYLIIEELVSRVYELCQKYFNDAPIKVKVVVPGGKHCPVTLIKKSEDFN